MRSRCVFSLLAVGLVVTAVTALQGNAKHPYNAATPKQIAITFPGELPTKTTPDAGPVIKSNQVVDISPPKLNFQCGIRPSFSGDSCHKPVVERFTLPPPPEDFSTDPHYRPESITPWPLPPPRNRFDGTQIPPYPYHGNGGYPFPHYPYPYSYQRFGGGIHPPPQPYPYPQHGIGGGFGVGGMTPLINSYPWTQGLGGGIHQPYPPHYPYPQHEFGGGGFQAGVGGFTPLNNSYPWTALMGWPETDGSYSWSCDGALINEHWIITAAHCFKFGPPEKIRLGEHDYNTTDDTPHHKDFGLASYIIHPQYVPGVGYHDLALVELSEKVNLQDEIAPVCLPWGNESSKHTVGEYVVLAGWGATEFGGDLSTILQEVHMEVFNSSTCDSSYSILPAYDVQFPAGITQENLLCVGYVGGGRDACRGDSGGPLTYCNSGVGHTLAGVVSKGNGCGLAEFPGLYAPLHRPDYLSWIKKTAF